MPQSKTIPKDANPKISISNRKDHCHHECHIPSETLLSISSSGQKPGSAKKGWNGWVILSEDSLSQLDWWIQKLPDCNGRSLIPENPTNILYTDASNTGWGASLENGLMIHGHWTHQE